VPIVLAAAVRLASSAQALMAGQAVVLATALLPPPMALVLVAQQIAVPRPTGRRVQSSSSPNDGYYP
jgi:hypothetical protein